jgi:hypothetical protein
LGSIAAQTIGEAGRSAGFCETLLRLWVTPAHLLDTKKKRWRERVFLSLHPA